MARAASRASCTLLACIQASTGFGCCGLTNRQRGFKQDARVGRLALHVPVCPRQFDRARRLVQQIQREPRLLAPVHGVATQPARLETLGQVGDMAGERRSTGGLLGKRQPQQQRIDARAVGEQCRHLGRPVRGPAASPTTPPSR